MWCGRIWWAAPAAPAAMAWRWIPRPAAWSLPARQPPTSTPLRSPTATMIPLSPVMTSDGSQTWVQQIQTLATNQANAVSVDASGNIYIGGSVSGGVVGAGQSSQGNGDAYLAKFDSTGNLLAENQFGTSGADQRRRHRHRPATAAFMSPACRTAKRSVQICQRQYHRGAHLEPGSGRAAGRRQHRRPGGVGQSGLCLRHHQQRQSHRRRHGHRRRAVQRRHRCFCLQPHRQWHQRHRQPCHLCRHFGQRPRRRCHGGPRRHRLSGRHHHRHFRGPVSATSPNVTNAFAAAHQSPMARCNGPDNSAAPTATPPARALPSIPMAPVCWTRWACRAAPSILTQSVDLTHQTTLRAGDTFQIQIQGVAPRTATITIDPGETWIRWSPRSTPSWASTGTAATNYTGNAEN